MESVEITVPGKTFIAGEYLALVGGPTLVFTSDPRFALRVRKKENSANPFHPASPAGKLFDKEREFFSQFEIQFQDPYFGKGGMGASSAAFALLHSLLQWKDLSVEVERSIDLQWLLKDYKFASRIEGNFPPSGADVVAQVCGGLNYFDKNNGKVQSFSWPFKDLKLTLWGTGNKLATHEHLKTLQAFETEKFEKAMTLIQQGLSQVNEELFIQGLKDYATELKSQNLVASHTLKFLELISQQPGICIAKGCGAYGADVIAVVHDEKQISKEQLLQKLTQMGLEFRGDESQISQAVKVKAYAHS